MTLRCCSRRSTTPAGPAPTLAAAAIDPAQRIRRLLGPAEPPLGPVRRLVLRAVVVALALTPVMLALPRPR